MKAMMITKATIVLLSALLVAPAGAQPGPGAGAGPGMWNGDGRGMGAGMGGMGGGMGRGGRGMRFDQSNVPGWSLMTDAERSEQQKKMRAVTTYDQCRQVQAEHRGLMETRASEKGVRLAPPRRNACDMMKARGIID